MRVLLILGSALLFTLVFADHHEGHHDGNDDQHDHKHDHDQHNQKHDHEKHHHHHHDHKDGHHKKGDHHHHNESLPCHKIAPSNLQFSFDLFQQVARDHPNENFVLSPVSISTALALLSLGAKGHTYTEIIEGLRLNTSVISEKEIHRSFHNLLDVLNDLERDIQLSGGSTLFISKERKILQTFLDEAKEIFHSEVFSADFKNTEEAKNQINSYVDKNTNGKIPELVESVDENAILFLISYIYLKAKWQHPFDEKLTKEGDFHIDEKKTVKVPFMTTIGYYDVAFTDEATAIFLPYKGNANALFILPKEGKLSEVEQHFNKEVIGKFKKSLHKEFVQLQLPKFTISGTVDLKETLTKFGIGDIFSDHADLSGITGEPNAKISSAIHKAVLTINENGTEAAGATAMQAIPMMLPTRLVYDHPFIFSLYDRESKSVLFSGRVANPEK